MKEFDAYIMYLALKQHFTTKTYDYFKYKGRVKANVESYKKRTDRWVFQKLSKHSDPLNLLVANFVSGEHFWIGDLEQCESVYRTRMGNIQSISYHMRTALQDLGYSVRELIDAEQGTPKIIDAFMANRISLECLVVFMDAIGCYSYWNKKLKHDVVWDFVGTTLRKYRPFIKYDKEKLKKDIKNACSPPFSGVGSINTVGGVNHQGK